MTIDVEELTPADYEELAKKLEKNLTQYRKARGEDAAPTPNPNDNPES